MRVLTDPELYEALRQDGLRQSALFPWSKAAEETLGVYRSVLEEMRPALRRLASRIAAMKDLRDFIELLRDKGQLAVIDTPVDPVLEITEIADRVVKAGGPALLFTHPKGSSFPVLINQFGSDERMCLALRAASYDELAARVQALVSLEVPERRPGRR